MMNSSSPHRGGAAAHMKAVALKLFAERGIDGVTVRQIAEAAGQKNHNALTYYFGSKDALIRELIVDGARAIDQRRKDWINLRAQRGGPATVFEVVQGLVVTSIDPDPPAWGECYNRFVVGLQMSNRAFFMEVVGGEWNTGYVTFLNEIRRLMPDLPSEVLNQRFVFLGSALGGILAAREAELADRTREHPMWSSPDTLDAVAQALTAIVENRSIGQ
ncbi:helix-turn-helix domain-containing protein [Novosphingobium cyanobacteriorum]|uniref:Helix-turn-helix domain containing protein n=1 Tax=Novosphingobium cyanobacteriorum TaxID=3024215 RepID=A0ABT6CLV1_9SPHN|nr:helix-turn-helix domain-containing protein [Novosphingobium cyanobacteriorum]MDF8334897.1 helix-turn-helix domain containing protein [Novosphingobium cyanobacteriorum]